MSDIHNVTVPDGQPIYQFYHASVEYGVWSWLEDSGEDVYTIVLSEIVPSGGGYSPKNVIAATVDDSALDTKEDYQAFMNDVMLPKFNAYLTKKGDENLDEFPADGSSKVKCNWIIKNKLKYVNGKLTCVL